MSSYSRVGDDSAQHQSNINFPQVSIPYGPTYPDDWGYELPDGSNNWIGRPYRQSGGYLDPLANNSAFERAQLSRLRLRCNEKEAEHSHDTRFKYRSKNNNGIQQQSPDSVSLGWDYPPNPQNSVVSGEGDNSPQQPKLGFPTWKDYIDHAQLPRVRNRTLNAFHGLPFAIAKEGEVNDDSVVNAPHYQNTFGLGYHNLETAIRQNIWPAYDPMADIDYVNTRKFRRGPRGGATRMNDGVLEYCSLLPGDDWVPAIRHHRSRKAFIKKAAEYGSYRETPSQGKFLEDDITSFHPGHQDWGPERCNWPKILFQYLPKAKDEHLGTPKPWYHEGWLVLDIQDQPMYDFKELPWTISSKVEPWRLLTYQRLNNNITLRDIRIRMPKEFKSRGNRGDALLLNRLSMRITRFRKEACCITWCKGGAPEIREYLDKLLPPECHERNSTETFRNLHDFEIAELDALTAGKHLGRTRGAIKDLSEARATHLKSRANEKARKLKEEFDAMQASFLESSPSSRAGSQKPKIKKEEASDDEVTNIDDHFEPITEDEGDEAGESAGEGGEDAVISSHSNDADDELEVEEVIGHRSPARPATHNTMVPTSASHQGSHLFTTPQSMQQLSPYASLPNQVVQYPTISPSFRPQWPHDPLLERVLHQHALHPDFSPDGTTFPPSTPQAQESISRLLDPTLIHLSRIMRVHPTTIPCISPAYPYKVQWAYYQAILENWRESQVSPARASGGWSVLVGLTALSRRRAVWNVARWIEALFGEQPAVNNGAVPQVFAGVI